MQDPIPDLERRGLLQDCTDKDALSKLLASKPVTVYVGFDPSGDSLHIGNLVPLLGLVRFQRAGHKPIALAGGATGLIGDPSGKDTERVLLDRERLAANIACIKAQLSRFLDFNARGNPAILVDNSDWLGPMSFLDFLRDVGKHFTVNVMIAKESVRARMEDREAGISYTEFSYMLLQACDFLHLHRTHGCELQAGGSDQWGNITAGIDLVRRCTGDTVHGLVFPLILNAEGKKFGKSETGESVWLDPKKTSTYRFYQHWMRVDDRDAIRFLNFFTFLDPGRIEELKAEKERAPEKRAAQAELAFQVTTVVHGEEAAASARRASQVMFGGSLEGVTEADMAEVAADLPSTTIARDALSARPTLVDLLAKTGLSKSKSEARRDLGGGGIYVNDKRASGETATAATEDALFGKYVLLRKGKKTYHVLRVE